MSFIKQQQLAQAGNRGNVFWHRASVDQAPFRGTEVPLLRDNEFEALAERVWDTRFGTFDTSQPDMQIMGRTLQDVLDGFKAGLYQILLHDHRWVDREHGPVMFRYLEWAEPYMELPSTPSGTLPPIM